MFWFKKKKIILDCFTSNAIAYEYFKPASALKYQPNWYKELPSSITVNDQGKDHNIESVKQCIAVRSLFKNSFILPSWSTYRFDISDSIESSVQWFCSTKTNMLSHSTHQMEGFLENTNWNTLKLECPWYFKSNKFINYTWHDTVWHKKRLDGFFILPAVLDFSVNYFTNVNIIFSFDDKPKTIIIEAGDPLVMITPNTEEEVEIRNHLVSDQEMRRIDLGQVFNPDVLNNKPSSYTYYKKKKILEDKAIKSISKCPFGFKK